MPAKTPKAVKTTQPVPEADFDDTIANNRAIEVLNPEDIPRPPAGYRPTNPDTRNRRLRRLASELRAEGMEALREAGERDLKAELGRYAPDPARAPALLARVAKTGKLVTAVQALLAYARELDQIAMSDVLVFLEAENKELAHAVEHEPALANNYVALQTLFAARASAIAEGMARSKEETAAPAPAPARTPAPAPAPAPAQAAATPSATPTK